MVPPPKPREQAERLQTCAPAKPKPPTHRSGWRPWHELLRRSFDVDREECTKCGGRMKLKGVYKGADSIERKLRQLREPTEPPLRAPARDPPTYKSRVLRRRAEQLC